MSVKTYKLIYPSWRLVKCEKCIKFALNITIIAVFSALTLE